MCMGSPAPHTRQKVQRANTTHEVFRHMHCATATVARPGIVVQTRDKWVGVVGHKWPQCSTCIHLRYLGLTHAIGGPELLTGPRLCRRARCSEYAEEDGEGTAHPDVVLFGWNVHQKKENELPHLWNSSSDEPECYFGPPHKVTTGGWGGGAVGGWVVGVKNERNHRVTRSREIGGRLNDRG